jgi:hypothetical protein
MRRWIAQRHSRLRWDRARLGLRGFFSFTANASNIDITSSRVMASKGRLSSFAQPFSSVLSVWCHVRWFGLA